MCGIAGWIGHIPGDREKISLKLCDELQHRGPDASGVYHLEYATLVHTRLSIIDLSPLGSQPMANEDGNIWVVFNGEIYNHYSLRQDLQTNGHYFRGRSDTEVLPHLYEHLGHTFPSYLSGMFAIAIYDSSKKRLLLVRDRFGIKPLYYAPMKSGLAFASEINALKSLPGIDLTPNRQAIFDYAALHFIPAPMTAYKGIRALEPGCILDVKLNEDNVDFEIHQYHKWSISPDTSLNLNDAVDQAENLIWRAVRSQLESDVPLGSLLSGGIDSSLVSAAAQQELANPIQTMNVKFEDDRYDETWAAVAVARHIQSQHSTLSMVDERDPWNYTVGLLWQAGQPYADTSLFAVNLVSKAMREHVTVSVVRAFRTRGTENE